MINIISLYFAFDRFKIELYLLAKLLAVTIPTSLMPREKMKLLDLTSFLLSIAVSILSMDFSPKVISYCLPLFSLTAEFITKPLSFCLLSL